MTTEARTEALWLPGRPVPFARTDRNPATGRRYNRAEYQVWLNAAAWEVKRQRGDTFTGPVAVSVTVFPNGIGVGITDALPARPKGIQGDLDNYLKAVADALGSRRGRGGGAILDDRQIAGLRATFHPAPGGPA